MGRSRKDVGGSSGNDGVEKVKRRRKKKKTFFVSLSFPHVYSVDIRNENSDTRTPTMTTSWAQRAAAAAASPAPASAPAIVVAGVGGGSERTTSAIGAADVDATPPQPSSFDPSHYVVLDTNALLLSGNGGVGLSRYAKIGARRAGEGGETERANGASASTTSPTTTEATLVTTQAALAEVRDAASREALQRLQGTGVCELVLREPEDEDVKAGEEE